MKSLYYTCKMREMLHKNILQSYEIIIYRKIFRNPEKSRERTAS